MVLKLSKKVHCADLNKESKSIKACYIYWSDRSYYLLSENGTVCYGLTPYIGDIRVWNW